jgi:hypothetical protein
LKHFQLLELVLYLLRLCCKDFQHFEQLDQRLLLHQNQLVEPFEQLLVLLVQQCLQRLYQRLQALYQRLNQHHLYQKQLDQFFDQVFQKVIQ